MKSMRRERGQALIEFTLSLFIILALMIGVVAFGMVFYTYITIDQMARRGVSYMLDNAQTLAQWNSEHPDQIDAPLIEYIKSQAGVLNTTEPYPMQIIISPPPEERVPGGFFEVTVRYTIDAFAFRLPNPFSADEVITVVPPIRLEATAGSFFE
ncbi:MAG: hypothetical protein DRI61_02635 [Chloroflexi bacterium]|nr:MAG: hypothetical protein DRI61_02635 [Chloroflexota bacterium]HDN80093.1 hypothetical protein [Chloroflexota bacterium]